MNKGMLSLFAALAVGKYEAAHPAKPARATRSPAVAEDKIELAKGKREKKAAKRARIAARNASPPNAGDNAQTPR